MNEEKRYRATFLKEEGGYDERFGESITALKHELKNYENCKNCVIYDTPTNTYKTINNEHTLHGQNDAIKEYSVVKEFLEDEGLGL